MRIAATMLALALASAWLAPAPVSASEAVTLDTAAEAIENWGGDLDALKDVATWLDQYLDEHPDDVRAMTLFSRAVACRGYLSGRKYDHAFVVKAENLLAEAIRRAPDSFVVLLTEAFLSSCDRDFTTARKWLDKAASTVRNDDEQAALDLQRASLLSDRGEYAAARDAVHQALDRAGANRHHAALLKVLIRATDGLKDVDAEMAAYRELLRVEPDNAWNYGNFAYLLIQHDRPDEGITMAKQSLVILDYPMAHRYLALAYGNQAMAALDADDLVSTERLALQSINEYQGWHAPHICLAHVYAKWGEDRKDKTLLTKARGHLQQALDLNPDVADYVRDALRRLDDVERRL